MQIVYALIDTHYTPLPMHCMFTAKQNIPFAYAHKQGSEMPQEIHTHTHTHTHTV